MRTNKEKKQDVDRLTAEKKIEKLKERFDRPGHPEIKDRLRQAIEKQEQIADKNRR